VPGQKVSKFKTLILTREHYLEKAFGLRKFANHLSVENTSIEMSRKLQHFIQSKNREISCFLFGSSYDLKINP